MTVTISNLVAGVYDIYAYGHGQANVAFSDFQLTAGLLNYGTEATIDGPGWLSPVWQEGVQYVEYTNVNVAPGQAITIVVSSGPPFELATISGLQLAYLAPASSSPFIATQPAAQAVMEGATGSFSVVAGGPGSLAYQWMFDNAPIPGATNSNCQVTNARYTNTGNYAVVVSNANASVTSTEARLDVRPPLIDVAFTDASVTPETGFAATGVGPNDFWNTYTLGSESLTDLRFVDGTASAAGLKVSNDQESGGNGFSDSMYNVYLSTHRAGGNMTVTISNLPAGRYQFYLYGHGGADSENGAYQLTVGSLDFGTESTRSGIGWFASAWQEGVQYVEFSDVNDGSGQTIFITALSDDAGYAVISGLQIAKVGALDSGPFIVTQPADQSVTQGATANFSVSTGGAAPQTFQWLFNNTFIPAATNSAFLVTNAQSTDAGLYSVIVADAFESVTSAPAALNVIAPVAQVIDVALSDTFGTGKTGFAATGIATNDIWNTISFYSAAVPDLVYAMARLPMPDCPFLPRTVPGLSRRAVQRIRCMEFFCIQVRLLLERSTI